MVKAGQQDAGSLVQYRRAAEKDVATTLSRRALGGQIVFPDTAAKWKRGQMGSGCQIGSDVREQVPQCVKRGPFCCPALPHKQHAQKLLESTKQLKIIRRLGNHIVANIAARLTVFYMTIKEQNVYPVRPQYSSLHLVLFCVYKNKKTISCARIHV